MPNTGTKNIPNHLSAEDRDTIFSLSRRGMKPCEIARIMNTSAVTAGYVANIRNGVAKGGASFLESITDTLLGNQWACIEWASVREGVAIPPSVRERRAAIAQKKNKAKQEARKRIKSTDAGAEKPEDKAQEDMHTVIAAEPEQFSIPILPTMTEENRADSAQTGLTDLAKILQNFYDGIGKEIGDAHNDSDGLLSALLGLFREEQQRRHNELLDAIRSLATDKRRCDNANADTLIGKLQEIRKELESIKKDTRNIGKRN